MFGDPEERMEHLVKRGQWAKIQHKAASKDSKTRAAVAEACGTSSDENAKNILIPLLRDPIRDVRLQAVRSIGLVGDGISKTHLLMLEQAPDTDEEMKAAIKEAIHQISSRR